MSENGVELYYETSGEGQPILVIHGGPGLDHTYLREPLLTLAQDHELIFYDQRCLGRSGGVPGKTRLTLDAHLHDIEVLCAHLCLEQCVLLGHSWGCLLAMLYASEHISRVKALVLLNPTPLTYEGILESDQEIRTRFSSDDLDTLANLTTSEPFLFGESEPINAFMRLWFKSYLASSDVTIPFLLGTQTCKNFAKFNAAMLRQFNGPNYLAALERITCPTLVTQGAQDVIPSARTEEICKAIPQCKRVVIDGCGHFPFLEAPRATFSAIRTFLQDV